MKKIITLLVLLTFFKGNTQCPAPSNINVVDNIALLNSVELSWSENGNATAWEIAVMANFNIGDPLPTFGTLSTNNPLILTNIPPGFGCYVFFVRSVCSVINVSPWVALATSGCSNNINNYLATLSTNDFSINNDNEVKIFPNPSSSILFIDNIEKEIQKIEIFDLQGRLLKTVNENKEKNQIDISNLSSATYLIKLSTETGSETIKVVKK